MLLKLITLLVLSTAFAVFGQDELGTTLRGLSGSGNARLGGSISGNTTCFISRKIPINSVGLFDSAAALRLKKSFS
jgi:hypothetical protein